MVAADSGVAIRAAVGLQMHRKTYRADRLRPAVAAGLLAALAGCSSIEGPSSKPSATAASSGSVSIGNRIAGFITGQSASSEAAATANSPPTLEDFDCPRIDIRAGASTLIIAAPGAEDNPLAVRYQSTFVRAARECSVRPPQLTIKVGVQGRVILGPAGGPGEVTIPLRYALVLERLGESRPIWSKLYTVPVSVPPREASVTFTHVESDLTVPIPRPADLQDYVIYIGFDPSAAPQKKPPPRARARPPA